MPYDSSTDFNATKRSLTKSGWSLSNAADTVAVQIAAGYVTDAELKGAKVGDPVNVTDSTGASADVAIASFDASGAATMTAEA